MMNDPKITRDDVARAAGVSPSTVSLALRGLARVAPATRKHVREVADRMGYQINNMASMLAQKRYGKTRSLLVGYLEERVWNKELFMNICAKRGWEGRLLLVDELPNPKSASRMLWQQGFDALIINSSPSDSPFWNNIASFDWSPFTVVKMSRALPKLSFNLMRHSAFDYQILCLEKMIALGYKRLAVLLHESSSPRDDQARLGATYAIKQAARADKNIQIEWRNNFFEDSSLPKIDRAFLKWLKNLQPDALVYPVWGNIFTMHYANISIPGNYPYAAILSCPVKELDFPVISGCDIQNDLMLEQALSVIERDILHGIRGFVKTPLEYVIEPVWIDGETLPPKKAS